MQDPFARFRGQLLTLLASALWGTSFVGVKYGLADLDPYWFLAARLALAAVIMVLLFGRRYRLCRYLRLGPVWQMAALMTAAYVLQFVGMQYTSASASAFLINFGVVFVALLSYLFLGEEFGWKKTLGVAVSVLGVYLLTTGGALSRSWGDLRGDVLVLVSGLFWAGLTVVNKRFLSTAEREVIPATTSLIFLTAIMVLPAALLLGRMPAAVAAHQITLIVYLAVFCTVVPFLLWFAGLQHVSSTVSAAVLLAEPVFAALLAYGFLQERMQAVQWWGAGLILVAIALVSIEPSAKRPVPVSEAMVVE